MSTNILGAMQQVEKIMDGLSPESRKQVLRWANKKYSVSPLEESDPLAETRRTPPSPETALEPDSTTNDGAKTGIFYFDKKGGVVVNPRKYIDRIRNEPADGNKK